MGASQGVTPQVLAPLEKGATSRRKALDLKMDGAKEIGCGNTLPMQLALARQAEEQTFQLARDVKTLIHWVSHDILALAGPALAERQSGIRFRRCRRRSQGLSATPLS
jgi:hypothetical protein